jgi:hypothetical protein
MKKILAFFLATLILVSGGGVFMSIHRCLSSSHSEISLSGKHSCCGKSGEDRKCESLKSKCCSVSTYYSKIHIVNFSDQKPFSVDDVIIPIIKPIIFCQSNIDFRFTNFHAPPPVECPVIAFRQLLI